MLSSKIDSVLRQIKDGATELCCEQLNRSEIEALFRAIESNRTLKKLVIQDTDFNHMNDLSIWLKKNSTLTELNINGIAYDDMSTLNNKDAGNYYHRCEVAPILEKNKLRIILSEVKLALFFGEGQVDEIPIKLEKVSAMLAALNAHYAFEFNSFFCGFINEYHYVLMHYYLRNKNYVLAYTAGLRCIVFNHLAWHEFLSYLDKNRESSVYFFPQDMTDDEVATLRGYFRAKSTDYTNDSLFFTAITSVSEMSTQAWGLTIRIEYAYCDQIINPELEILSDMISNRDWDLGLVNDLPLTVTLQSVLDTIQDNQLSSAHKVQIILALIDYDVKLGIDKYGYYLDVDFYRTNRDQDFYGFCFLRHISKVMAGLTHAIPKEKLYDGNRYVGIERIRQIQSGDTVSNDAEAVECVSSACVRRASP